jgi:hypothetical protein
MTVGGCSLCKKAKNCRLRQPGTWVVDCDLFEEILPCPGVQSRHGTAQRKGDFAPPRPKKRFVNVPSHPQKGERRDDSPSSGL